MATGIKKKMGVGRHASAIKRAKQAKVRRARNKHAVSAMKTAVKAARAAGTLEVLAKAVPVIAKSARKGAIHRKKASRLISRLTKAANKKK